MTVFLALVAEMDLAAAAAKNLKSELVSTGRAAEDTNRKVAAAEAADATSGMTGGPDQSGGNNVGSSSSVGNALADITAGITQQVGRKK